MEDEREPSLIRMSKAYSDYSAHEESVDDLQNFRLYLKWICLDQSNIWRASLSWSVFFLLVIVVPLVSDSLYSCSSCDEKHRRQYDSIVQLSLSVLAILSFFCLSSWARKYGFKKFLFFDRLCDVSDKVRQGYTEQLHRSTKLLFAFVLPCFAVEIAYKIWWYASGASQIPFYGNVYVSDTITCTLQLCSWLYRTTIFLLTCVLYRLICYLQILRLEDFAQVFQNETEVAPILKEHFRIRRNLRIISHRFRVFILLTLILVTASQLASLLGTIRPSANVNIFKAGELALCSISLVTGLFICLRSATKITHKAQSLTCLAAKWHVCATVHCFDESDGETSTAQISTSRVFAVNADWESDDDEEEDGGDDLDNTKLVPIHEHTISFQKRQALVTYLEHNRAGVTVYGFMLDRTSLHTIFVNELSLLLWLLNKTAGV